MKQKLMLLLLAVAVGAAAVSAQSRRNLRINEVMVQNDSNFVDDYGHHTAWIELFNTTHAPLNIASVFLTNNRATLDENLSSKERKAMMYAVPLGDVLTKIPKRQHVVFWADGRPTLGTFHTSFTLQPGQDNWIAIFDGDGHTLIDSVTVPATLGPDQSFARIEDGVDSKDGVKLGIEAWEIRDDSEGLPVTPSSNNKIRETNDKIDMFAEKDKNGVAMAIMAMGIVFSALLLLCICFYIISKIGERNKTKTLSSSETEIHVEKGHDSGEEIAAIAMALHEHLNAHDSENTILTINKVKRAYSPWSSKIYGLRQLPQK